MAGTTPPSPTTCSYQSCPNQGRHPDNLLKCSRCKESFYCDKTCQKKDWNQGHKFRCASPDVARHEVPECTIASIQETVDKASPGDIVILKAGIYRGSGDESTQSSLHIRKPIKLWGSTENEELKVLECNLTVFPSGNDNDDDSEGAVILADFHLHGVADIQKNVYKSVTMYNVRVRCPVFENGDALNINECKNKCLILGCEIVGGSDGVFISSDSVHLKNTKICYAQSRGIFSRREFTIEDCEVSGCGSYGIKGTGGWCEKGRNNNIQPGPWNEYGGASGGYGGFGGMGW